MTGGSFCTLKKVSIYAIPSIISSIFLFLFFLIGLARGREKRENLLLSFVCLIGFLLNTDKTILSFLEDERLALTVSRIDHIFLVFIAPLYLHFTVSLTGREKFAPLYRILYVLSAFLLPFTQTDYYLTQVRRYYFGFFAQAGPIFFVFGFLSATSILISIWILIESVKHEMSPIKRTRVKYILLSMGISAIINHLDVLPMLGYEMYPLGNFVFLPMSLIVYAIYKDDIMEWRVFLSKGLSFILHLLLSLSIFFSIFASIYILFGPELKETIVSLLSFICTFVISFFLRDRLDEAVKNFTLKELREKRRLLRNLSLEMMRLSSVEDLKDLVSGKLKEIFQLSKCELRGGESTKRDQFGFFEDRDPEFKEGFRTFFSIPSKFEPHLLLLGERKDMSLYTDEEIELMALIADNLALALDNAEIYRRLKEFSENLEAMVEERTKALIKSESLAAIGRLAAGVAHELNNPLASVKSTIEYLCDHLDKAPHLSEDLEFCLSEIRRAESIVRSLLFSARQKDERKTETDLKRAVEDALRVLQNEIKKRDVSIVKEFLTEDATILGIHSRICQVFINLIKNALDAIGEKKGEIRIVILREGEKLKLLIEDNGCGMGDEELKNLFRPFFTTKEQGMGLGLYIVREIVSEHMGEIEVESRRGEGSKFTITFPAYRQQS